MFKTVDSRPDFPAMEVATLAFWRETGAFERLVQKWLGSFGDTISIA